MRQQLLSALDRNGGVLSRAQALAVAPAHVLDRAVQAKAVVRVFPRVYVRADSAADCAVLDQAAIVYGGPASALSHSTALRLWLPDLDLPVKPRHLTTPPEPHLRGTAELLVHRRKNFAGSWRYRAGALRLPAVPIEQALVESRGQLPPPQWRAAAIEAVSRRLTTGRRLLRCVFRQPTAAGAAEMQALFSLLAHGCRSELELWGHRVVFDHPMLPAATLQHRVVTPAGAYELDRAYLEEMVAVELDGAAFHGSRRQRERDIRRDAALAAAGWLVVRFTHERLHRDPTGCRLELAAILAARRRQFGLTA
ncbi:MAG TPA: DUF559 domain-containing protein [Mycobacteriales bacterium]|nr:DUF559 domain-containing protein [Mycobacteriales bacterium]